MTMNAMRNLTTKLFRGKIPLSSHYNFGIPWPGGERNKGVRVTTFGVLRGETKRVKLLYRMKMKV